MIARIIWVAALLGIAIVSTAVHLDREARRTASLALYVPEIFRSGAQPRITALAIDSGIPEIGVAQAQKLVRRRPLPARHLRLLAQAQFAAGNNEASALAIQYAAQRGWRDALAQEAMMQIALAAGNRPEAARRYAALFLMRGTERALLEETGDAVFPEPGGEERMVFAQIVSGGERWHNAFLTRGARVMPPDAFVEIIEISAKDGTQFRCAALRQAQKAIEGEDQTLGKRLSSVLQSQC
ncbi:hypothetical protein EH31_16930 [Erythrobacter longus]|uniref:Uncharacterized protein n=1 Tax=Erythrobacter longus TaxID=1044 RepID=A0A074M7G9_ERYLO|nr:hypothetical protein [Erythrobacter longus]KEO88640.1 hypothetical protein EH31_16930 [Erythrobacter longus]